MKKLLTLVLVMALALTVIPMGLVSADAFGYSITAGSISSSNGRFNLAVAPVGQTAAGGVITIDYDTTKVTLVIRDTVEDPDTGDSTTVYNPATAADATNKKVLATAGGAAVASANVDVENGRVKVAWYNQIAAGTTLGRFWFVAADKSGENFDATTFTLVEDAATLAAWNLTGNGGNAQISDVNSVKSSTEAGNIAVSFTYPNSDKAVGGQTNFTATVSGTTITCAGKVDATVSNYGVEFTAASTIGGTRAQKYYGAMNGDTVGDYNGNTTFTIGDWNGSFEIVLEGVHAGEKELNFFADDAIIANSNCKVTVQ